MPGNGPVHESARQTSPLSLPHLIVLKPLLCRKRGLTGSAHASSCCKVAFMCRQREFESCMGDFLLYTATLIGQKESRNIKTSIKINAPLITLHVH